MLPPEHPAKVTLTPQKGPTLPSTAPLSRCRGDHAVPFPNSHLVQCPSRFCHLPVSLTLSPCHALPEKHRGQILSPRKPLSPLGTRVLEWEVRGSSSVPGVCRGGTAPNWGVGEWFGSAGGARRWLLSAGTTGTMGPPRPPHPPAEGTQTPQPPGCSETPSTRTQSPPQVGKLRHDTSPRTPGLDRDRPQCCPALSLLGYPPGPQARLQHHLPEQRYLGRRGPGRSSGDSERWNRVGDMGHPGTPIRCDLGLGVVGCQHSCIGMSPWPY